MKHNFVPDVFGNARAYLAKMPPAISGSGGHNATYKAALALVKGFNLAPDDAFPILWEWNAACLPPWSERDLRHKLTDAQRSATPDGYLLKERRDLPADEAAEKARARAQWPAFRTPTADDLAAIAALRGVSVEAAWLITWHRHLWCCRYSGADCFAIRSGAFAQVRRMDGQPLTNADGHAIKSKNLPGSEGAWLNPGGMGAPDVPIMLTEGAISILETAEAVLRSQLKPTPRVAALAAASAGSRFATGQLEKVKGRRVRIIADHDDSGRDGAAKWTAALRGVGCKVDAVLMPEGCKDLGDALRVIPAGDSYWQQLFNF